MIGGSLLNKVLDKIKERIGVNTKLLIKTNDKSPDKISLNNVATLNSSVIKDDKKFYPQVFYKKNQYHKHWWEIFKMFMRKRWTSMKVSRS